MNFLLIESTNTLSRFGSMTSAAQRSGTARREMGNALLALNHKEAIHVRCVRRVAGIIPGKAGTRNYFSKLVGRRRVTGAVAVVAGLIGRWRPFPKNSIMSPFFPPARCDAFGQQAV